MFHNIQVRKFLERALVFCLLFLLVPGELRAVPEIELDVRQIAVSDNRDGRNNIIKAIQDRDGFIWMASIRTLYVHDGRQLRPALTEYLGATNIRDIHIDRRDTLWVATASGLLAYSLLTNKATWYHAAPGRGGLTSDIIQRVYEDRMGVIWVGTMGGLHRYDEVLDTFTPLNIVPPSATPTTKTKTVFDILADARGNIWLATTQGLLLLDPDRRTATIVPSASGQPLPVRSLAEDGNGDLWVKTQGRGLWKVDGRASRPSMTEVPEFSSTHIRDLRADSIGDIWIGSKNGLYRYSTADQTLIRHSLTNTDRLRDRPINIASINELRGGEFMIGTWDSGAYQGSLRPASRMLEVFTNVNGQPQKLLRNQCLFNPQDNRVYVAPIAGGLYRSQPLPGGPLPYLNHLEVELFQQTTKVYALFLDAQHGLIATMQDYFLYVAPTGEISRIETPRVVTGGGEENSFRFIAQTTDGRIWLAEHLLLCSWVPGETSVSRHSSSVVTMNIVPYGSSLLLASRHEIIHLQDNATLSKSVFDQPRIISMFHDTGENLWVGSADGLFRLHSKTFAPTVITLDSGAPIRSAQSFWESPDGAIWLHNQDAIYVVHAGDSIALKMLTGAANPSEAITASPTVLPGNILLYGHSAGLLLVDPAILAMTSTPKAVISDLRIFDQPVPASGRGSLPMHLELNHRQNYLSFGFSTPGFSALRQPRYLYKLDGVDKDWIQSDARDYATYAHLDPGEYAFLVREESDTRPPTTLTFVIAPPWWLTPWAKSGYVIVGFVIVCAAFLIATQFQAGRIRREMLETLVMQDPLTGIPNRRRFNEVLATEKSRCKRTRSKLALIMIDVDYFKGFNDRFGHQAGDEALRAIARTLRNVLGRPEDFVARYGGEEFVVVLPNTDRDGAERVAKKIQAAVAEANIAYPGSAISDRVTVSLGISSFTPETDMHIESGLFSADQALYHAKRNGRNRFFYKDLNPSLGLLPACKKAVHSA